MKDYIITKIIGEYLMTHTIEETKDFIDKYLNNNL